MSGFGRIVLIGAVAAAVAGVASLRAQTQLGDPRDAPRIFSSTCSACHKSPQGLAKSGQVAGFLRQHYTTGPEMSAAMAAYLVAAGSAPAKKSQAEAKPGQSAESAAKAKAKKQEQAAIQAGQTPPGADAKERRTLRGKQQQMIRDEATAPPTAAPTDGAAPAAPAAATAALTESRPAPAAAPEPGPPPVVFDLPLPEMPTGPPADLTQSAFSSSPLP